jgi:hypothetical protein
MDKLIFGESGKHLRFWALGFTLGLLVGYVPLLFDGGTDPFDNPSSYLAWFMGLFLSAMLLSIADSRRVWRWAFAVGLGLPAAVIVDIIIKPETYQLPPLTVIFSVVVGIPTAFAGAYSGKLIKGKL